jgi:hypothetical protein
MKTRWLIKQHSPNLWPIIAAAVVGSFVMAVSGLTYRALASRQEVPVNSTRMDPAVLKGFPWQIGDWLGEDIPLSEAVVDATGTDAYINRRYSRNAGSEFVLLYIACGANVNELMSHRPTGCYRAAGYQLVERYPTVLSLASGTKVPCYLYEFYRDDLDVRKVAVLHYCFANGRYFDEVNAVRSMGNRGMRPIEFAAQIQIVSSVNSLTADSAISLVSAFSLDSVSSIDQLFRGIEHDGGPRE